MPNQTEQEVLEQQGCLGMSENGELHLGLLVESAASSLLLVLSRSRGACGGWRVLSVLHQAAESCERWMSFRKWPSLG